MTRMYFLAALTSLTLCSFGVAYGAPKLKADTPSTGAKAMFENIDTLSDAILQEVSSLHSVALKGQRVEGDFDGLAIIKEDVNKIGNEIGALNAMRDSLVPWEVEALAQTAPLIREVAVNTDKAIQASNQMFMPSVSYIDNLVNISRNAERVKTVVHDYLKLESVREKELRIEHSLEEAAGS